MLSVRRVLDPRGMWGHRQKYQHSLTTGSTQLFQRESTRKIGFQKGYSKGAVTIILFVLPDHTPLQIQGLSLRRVYARRIGLVPEHRSPSSPNHS
jgi:hypothetical protein